MNKLELVYWLEWMVSIYFDRLVRYLDEYWASRFDGFNDGQQVIYSDNMVFTIEEWIEFALYDWPWVDPWALVDALYACYQMDVMERAFSDSIEDPVDQMWDIIDKAQRAQERLDIIQILL